MVISPPFITLVHRGLEASFLSIFLILLIIEIHKFKSINPRNIFFLALICEVIRIDSIIYLFSIFIGLIISSYILSDKVNLKLKLSNLLYGSFLGLIINFGINQLLYDSFFPHTAIAKKFAYLDKSGIFSFFQNTSRFIFGNKSFLLPVANNSSLSWPFGLFSCFLLIFSIYKILIYLKKKFNHEKSIFIKQKTSIFTSLTCISILSPLPYLFNGHTFPWYYWISALTSYNIIIWYLDLYIFRNKILLYFLGLFFINIIVIKYIASVNVGTQESIYRAGIGKYINKIADKDDTLILEPAGWIPYYAKIRVLDEIGLTSKKVTEFHKYKKNNQSLVSFWEKEKPTFLLQRTHIFNKYDVLGNRIIYEYKWFKKNYYLLKQFSFKQIIDSEKNPIKRFILKLNGPAEYYLYKRIDEINFLLKLTFFLSKNILKIFDI